MTSPAALALSEARQIDRLRVLLDVYGFALMLGALFCSLWQLQVGYLALLLLTVGPFYASEKLKELHGAAVRRWSDAAAAERREQQGKVVYIAAARRGRG